MNETAVVMEATRDAVGGARRSLIVVSILLCVGTTYVILWHLSWERARIAAREALIAANEGHADASTSRGSTEADTVTELKKECSEILKSAFGGNVTLPMIGLTVSKSDFPVALLLLCAAVFLWHQCYLGRIRACITRLIELVGGDQVHWMIRLQFVLIGPHTKGILRVAITALFFGPAVLGAAFVASDLIDLAGFRRAPALAPVWKSDTYLTLVRTRVALDVGLIALNLALGTWAFSSLRALDKLISGDLRPLLVQSEAKGLEVNPS